MDARHGWEFWVDRGGTFTDVVARDPEGRIHIHKLLSENPDQYEDAPLHAIRHFLGLAPSDPIPSEQIAAVKMGTTLATNALLERKGAAVALITTKGFADVLEIGYQDRPDLFALKIVKPQSLAACVIEAEERMLADGQVKTPLAEAPLRKALKAAYAKGIRAIAVLFLHSYANPDHECRVAVLARDLGFDQISLSHQAAKEIKAVGRGDTTLADAYLSPLLMAYVQRLRAALGPKPLLRFMQSNGGLTEAENFTGKNAILSGPAGGVVAYAHLAKQAGFEKVIGFDMGGTSTDVSRYDGRFEHRYESQTAGVRIKAPMLDIRTVAAGGGSLLRFDGRRLRVGPESAGALPGPACYGRGGPAALTDANLVLGRLQPAWFPKCFGPKSNQPLDRAAARRRLAAIADQVTETTGKRLSVEACAAGFIRIANENMVKPIKEISVSRGYDVQEYALACFGGAGAQHACAIAEALGMGRILLHPCAGVLSAYGMGLADMIHSEAEAVLTPYTEEAQQALDCRYRALEAKGAALLKAEGFAFDQISHRRSMDLRYAGVESSINTLCDTPDLLAAFEARHQQLYGFTKPGHPVEIVAIRLESTGQTEKVEEARQQMQPRELDARHRLATAEVYFDHLDENGNRPLRACETPVYDRAALTPGARVAGPALIVEAVSTIVVDPGWRAQVNAFGHLLLSREKAASRKQEKISLDADPVMLEIFNNLFMSVATQMGKTLERVSHSANIKERLDFSCALFDAQGALIANAPHIPVHLGAMGESVRAILRARGAALRPGDALLTNDPYHGGSHLPDITVISPVFSADKQLQFFVANRGHHADIGGISPGSMPPFSKSIEEEGIILHDFLLLSEGEFQEEALCKRLSEGPWPARNLLERLSDLCAQLAANATGLRLLNELRAKYGDPVLNAYMRHVYENAAAAMRELLASLPQGKRQFTDYLDDGAPIVCTLDIQPDHALVDFTGAAPQRPGNLNAPPAVVRSAVLYVFRTLINRPIPLNEGCLDPIEIRLPKGSLLHPAYPAAVVGGNVETSIRICDALYGALGAVAASQGTMNNLSFGDKNFGYYETLCGGAGAGPDFDGADAIHTHMTNTRITDPEVLERRYPVLLRQFAIRRGSGGAGRHRGGDGVIRELEFLRPVHLAILSERRTRAPYGLAGGEAGQPGRNTLIHDGQETVLPGHAEVEIAAGDRLRIETPGGGGYGPQY